MKNLLNKKGIYYLSDDVSDVNGQTLKVTGDYKPTKDNMPHIRFKTNIVLYGRYSCPYCIATVDFLKTKEDLYKRTIFIEVDMANEPLFKKSKLLEILKPEIGTHSTVPLVFDKGKFIGGSSDTKDYFSKK